MTAPDRKPNRLANETSTYLRQHAGNPVDWYPWGEEALSRSRSEDKPILLSVGYSACHWCHVMEHESFEDDSTAALMNEHFINIKVDREERTDLDEIYMKAVQMLTGHGGWPMTVFLTPQLMPFFAGTYFPKEDRHGMPSFKRILSGIHRAWTEQRGDVEESSQDITRHLKVFDRLEPSTRTLDSEIMDIAVDALNRVFDSTWGGFGGAPKFPHSSTLSFLCRRIRPGKKDKGHRELECLEMVSTTLDKMACGGMYDHLGGGFARYSVDRKWLIPHFEKMLYDNALLIPNYLDGFLITGRDWWARVARESLDFVLRELNMPEGGFYCSLDADSEGEEGKYYVWRRSELVDILGEGDGKWIAEVYGVTESGNFEHGTSALNFPEPPETMAAKVKLPLNEFWERLNPLREKLLAKRESRIRPGRDEKMLTSWTSLMISALVAGFRVLGDRKYLDAARKATSFILEKLYVNGRLLRTYGMGQARLNGYLDDYAYFIQALLDLASVDGDGAWLSTCLDITDATIQHFLDSDGGGFYYTADDHEELISRSKHAYDGSTPSAASVMVMNLLRLSRITDDQKKHTLAEETLCAYGDLMARGPSQFSNFLCGLDFMLAAPSEIAVVYNNNETFPFDHLTTIHGVYNPNCVIVACDQSKSGKHHERITLLKDRQSANSGPAVYICQNYACQKPVSDLKELKELVAGS